MENRDVERRLFWISVGLLALGSILAWLLFDLSQGVSFLAGGILAVLSVLWLRDGLNAVILKNQKAAKRRALAGFLLRLLLIPLCLYVMIRFLFLSGAAAVIGFAVSHCSIFVEGILEAFKRSPGNDARAE